MATNDSAPLRPATDPGAGATLSLTDAEQVAAGGAAVKALIHEVWCISEATVWSLHGPDVAAGEETLDARDYPKMATVIQHALSSMVDAPAAFRQGACRAIADVFANWADNTFGCGNHDWDPLLASEAAFVRTTLIAGMQST